MMQAGLFDWQTRFEQLDNGGDPLVKLNAVVDWELFRSDFEAVRDKDRKSNAGRKPFDVIWMFKILILQSLYIFRMISLSSRFANGCPSCVF